MISLNEKNNSNGKIPPFWGFSAFTPTIPKLYWNVKSQEQRILNLFDLLNKLVCYTDEISSSLNDLETVSPDDFVIYQKNIKILLDDMKSDIDELSIGSLAWDVTRGEYKSSKEVQRNLFNDVTVHAITVKKLNSLDMTVSELANCGLSVRGLAVMSYWLVEKFDLSEDFEAKQYSYIKDGVLDATKLNVAKVRSDGTVFIPEEFRG